MSRSNHQTDGGKEGEGGGGRGWELRSLQASLFNNQTKKKKKKSGSRYKVKDPIPRLAQRRKPFRRCRRRHDHRKAPKHIAPPRRVLCRVGPLVHKQRIVQRHHEPVAAQRREPARLPADGEVERLRRQPRGLRVIRVCDRRDQLPGVFHRARVRRLREDEEHVGGPAWIVGKEAGRPGASQTPFREFAHFASDKELKEVGAQVAAVALRANSTLQSIGLSWNAIGQEGAKALADALRTNTSLKSINLSSNSIGDEGGKALADALTVNSTLQSIDLSWNGIGQEGAKALAFALRTNTSLKIVDLRLNEMGPVGEKALADVEKCKTTLKVQLYPTMPTTKK
ncbi:hypothetical protein DFJ73DRAFT_913631 [Zopfochytrium polystomum]|nr:hypothetical protein DFJ73DRAFT_913631 [Zopfochytrium polystomum]